MHFSRFIPFILLCLSGIAEAADQKPVVVNPTTGRNEQLQAGNNLALPDASGDLITVGPGVQTAPRTITLPVMTGNRTLAVIDQAQTFSAAQTMGDTLGVTGATTLGNTLAVTGEATLSGGALVPAGQAYKVNGAAGEVILQNTARTDAVAVLKGSAGTTHLTIYAPNTNYASLATALRYVFGSTTELNTNYAGQFNGGIFASAESLISSTVASTSPSTGALVVNGGVGIGSKSYIAGSVTTAADGQLNCTDSANTNKRLRLGFDGTSNIGWIQATEDGVANRPLHLNPNGTSVVVGGATTLNSTLAIRGASTIGAITVATASETNPAVASAWDATKHSLLAGPGTSTNAIALAGSVDQTANECSVYALSPGVSWRDLAMRCLTFSIRCNGATAQFVQSATGTTLTGTLNVSGATTIDSGATFNSNVAIKAGTSASYTRAGGALFYSTTAVGNVGVGDDVLQTTSIPANALATNGDSIEGYAAGTFGASANNKRLRVKFGATTVFDSGSLAITVATDWALKFQVIRSGATTQKCVVTLSTSSTTLSSYADYATAAETLSGAVTMTVNGEGTADNDIVAELWKGSWSSAP